MATIVKTPVGTWKAVIRKQGWPTAVKAFRTKRDAEDWARQAENEMVRDVHIQRAPSQKLTVAAALDRYLRKITPTKAVRLRNTPLAFRYAMCRSSAVWDRWLVARRVRLGWTSVLTFGCPSWKRLP